MGDMAEAQALVRVAHESGCQAVKLQKRDLKTLYTAAFYNSPYNSELAYGPTYGTHRAALEFNAMQYAQLRDYATSLGLAFFATPFDEPSVDFLEDIGVPFYKIASAGAQNPALLRKVAATGKPVIVSLGGVPDKRVPSVVGELPANTIMMHCTAAYPTKPEDLGLLRVAWLRDTFPNHVIGLSDHEDGLMAGPVAYALGARVFEKHITRSHSNKGTDHAFSLEPEGLRRYVGSIRKAEVACRRLDHPVESEVGPLKKMGYSIYAARHLEAGQILTYRDVAIKSPSDPDGIPAWDMDEVLGLRCATDVPRDAMLRRDTLERP